MKDKIKREIEELERMAKQFRKKSGNNDKNDIIWDAIFLFFVAVIIWFITQS